jgi:hypothetical protein
MRNPLIDAYEEYVNRLAIVVLAGYYYDRKTLWGMGFSLGLYRSTIELNRGVWTILRLVQAVSSDVVLVHVESWWGRGKNEAAYTPVLLPALM